MQIDEMFRGIGSTIGVIAPTRDPHPRMPGDVGQKWSAELSIIGGKGVAVAHISDPTELRRLAAVLVVAAVELEARTRTKPTGQG